MSNHNYSQYSNKPKNSNRNPNPNFKPQPSVNNHTPVEEPVANIPTAFVTGTTVEPVVEPVINLVEETVETKPIPELVKGTVAGCTKLNVRSTPSITGEVVVIISADSDVQIDITKSNHEWFHVCTATGAEGYCMRKFVNAYL